MLPIIDYIGFIFGIKLYRFDFEEQVMDPSGVIASEKLTPSTSAVNNKNNKNNNKNNMSSDVKHDRGTRDAASVMKVTEGAKERVTAHEGQ